MSFEKFQASVREMTVAEYDAAELPAGLSDDVMLRVYAGGGVIVSTGWGWRLHLAPGDCYTTTLGGVTLAQLERLLWIVSRSGGPTPTEGASPAGA